MSNTSIAAHVLENKFQAKIEESHDINIRSTGTLNVQPGNTEQSYIVSSNNTFLLLSPVTIASSQTVTLHDEEITWELKLPNGQIVEVLSGTLTLYNVSSLTNNTDVYVQSGSFVIADGASTLGRNISVGGGLIKLRTISSVAGKGFDMVYLSISGNTYSDSSSTTAGDTFVDNIHINNELTMDNGKKLIRNITVDGNTDIRFYQSVILVIKNISTSNVTITTGYDEFDVIPSRDSQVYLQISANRFNALNFNYID